jgi:hypothetical protein
MRRTILLVHANGPVITIALPIKVQLLHMRIMDFKSLFQGDMGWMARVHFLAGATDFPLLHSIQTGSEAHLASYPLSTEGSFPGSKSARA